MSRTRARARATTDQRSIATASARRSVAAGQPGEPVRVLRQFRVVFNAVKTHFQQVERQAGASGAQVWALHVISEHPGLGVNDLARAMEIRQPTASIFVKALAGQQLIEVRREGADRRAVQLHVLPAGTKVLREAPGPFTGVLPQALASLDRQTLRRLEKDLARLIHELGADERAGSVPLGSV
jgi:DNA-binding MarR family transcriptional regulator